MVGSIREILKITDTASFLDAQHRYDEDLEAALETLRNLLDMNIMSTDVTDIMIHMSLVESYRARLVKYMALAVAFTEHAKSSTFRAPKGSGSEDDRKAHQRHIAAASEAIKVMLDGLISCVDSRVNECKKVIDIEGAGAHYGSRRVA